MLEQRMQQTQRQIVTPSQLQGLELLAMNGAELADFVNQEQLENPLLEVEPEAGPGEGDSLVDIAQWLQDTSPQVENGVYLDDGGPGRELSAGPGRTYRDDLKEQLYSLGIGAGRL